MFAIRKISAAVSAAATGVHDLILASNDLEKRTPYQFQKDAKEISRIVQAKDLNAKLSWGPGTVPWCDFSTTLRIPTQRLFRKVKQYALNTFTADGCKSSEIALEWAIAFVKNNQSADWQKYLIDFDRARAAFEQLSALYKKEKNDLAEKKYFLAALILHNYLNPFFKE